MGQNDTDTFCFFCLKILNELEDKQLQNILSIQSFLHYLDLDVGELPEGNKGRLQKGDMITSCENCSKVYLKFQEQFRILQQTEIKLSLCLGEIGSLMKAGNSRDNHRDASSSGGKLIQREMKIRSHIIKVCSRKFAAFQPEVELQANDPEVEVKLKQLQIKTEALPEEPFRNHEGGLNDAQPEIDLVTEIKQEIPSETSDSEPEEKPTPKRVKKCQDYKIIPDPSKPDHYLCILCNRSFRLHNSCRKHFRRVHLNLDVESYECLTCHQKFRSHSGLGDHWDRVHSGKKFECQYCQKACNSKRLQTKHEVTCPSRLPSKCKLCPQEFIGKLAHWNHIDQAHADVYKFVCKTCGKRFTIVTHLKTHIQDVHEKKGSQSLCKICGKSFCNDVSLKTHTEVVHLKVKKHGCNLCDKRYASASELRRHQSVDHLGKKFTCTEPGCGKQYREKKMVTFHMLKDHGHGPCELELKRQARELCGWKSTVSKIAEKPEVPVRASSSVSHHLKIPVPKMPNNESNDSGTAAKPEVDQTLEIKHSPGEPSRENESDIEPKTETQPGLKIMSNERNDGRNERTHECQVCHKGFASYFSLHYHKWTIHSDATSCCRYCTKCFKCRAYKLKHESRCQLNPVRSSRDWLPSQCTSCQKSFLGQAGLKLHMAKAHCSRAGSSSYKSELCEKIHKSQTRFQKHNGSVHNNVSQLPEDSSKDNGEECRSDAKPEVDLVAEIKHEISSPLSATSRSEVKSKPKRGKIRQDYKIIPDPSKPDYHLCTLCNRSFRLKKSCQKHFRRNHLNLDVLSYECKTCHQTFKSCSALGDHRDRIHSGKSFVCRHCQKPCNSQRLLDRHEVTCSSRLPSKCKLCSQEFIGKLAHQNHIELDHVDVYKFVCQVCGKRFQEGHALKKHVQDVHEKKDDEKMCKICDKVFYSSDSLRSHTEVVHLKVKKHACHLCDKRYATPRELRRHVGVDHLGKKFKCTEPGCVSEHREAKMLIFHMLKEHGQRPSAEEIGRQKLDRKAHSIRI